MKDESWKKMLAPTPKKKVQRPQKQYDKDLSQLLKEMKDRKAKE